LPYLTVAAAAAVAQTGDVVMVRPGTYPITALSGLAVPAGVAIIGSGQTKTTLAHTAITGGGTMINMGVNSSLRELSLNMTSAINDLTLVGVLFGSTTLANASVENVAMSIDNAGTTTTTQGLYGVRFASSGVAPFSFVNLSDCSVKVVGRGTTTGRALLMDTATGGQAYVVGGEYSANPSDGAFTQYGAIDCALTGCSMSLSDLSAQGTLFDISQNPGSTLSIDRTCALATGGTNGLNFTTTNPGSSTQLLSVGALGAVVAATTRYPGLWSMTETYPANTSATAAQMTVLRVSIFKNLSITASAGPGVGQTFVATLLKNNVATTLTATLSGASTAVSNTANAVTFYTTDLISMSWVTSAGAAATDIRVVVECY
jgi:hypothetical protein